MTQKQNHTTTTIPRKLHAVPNLLVSSHAEMMGAKAWWLCNPLREGAALVGWLLPPCGSAKHSEVKLLASINTPPPPTAEVGEARGGFFPLTSLPAPFATTFK